MSTRDVSWLLDGFADAAAGVSHAVAVSADGLLIGTSRYLPQDRAEQLAAVVAGLVSLANGASRCLEVGTVRQTVVEMNNGLLFLMSVGDGSALAALASRTCDAGQVGYEMALLVDRVGGALESVPRPTITAAP